MASLSRIEGAGRLAFDNSERRLPEYQEMAFDDDGWIYLSPGIYLATYNEVVNIHKDLFAFARTRSSLLRMGATLYTALWDTGYIGRSQTPINVINPEGIYLQKGARLLQLVFVTLGDELTAVYNGAYHGENM
jgi:dUTP pyrophosphatase